MDQISRYNHKKENQNDTLDGRLIQYSHIIDIEMPLVRTWTWSVDLTTSATTGWGKKRKSRTVCIMILPSDITRVTVVEHNAATSRCSSPRNIGFDEQEHLLNDQHVVVVKILKTDGKEKNCYHLESIQMTKSQNKECKFTGGYGDAKEEMEARFKSESDLDVFVKILEGLKRRQIARREHTLHQFLALKGLDPSSNLVVEMQVCSARNLPVADIKSSDPYCIIRMGNKEVHRTGVIKGNLNPKWTEKTKFSYTMFTTYKELFTSCEKIEFEVRDYDSLKTGESLGTVRLSPKAIVEAAQDGVEGEFRISNEEPNNSFLTLKFIETQKQQPVVQVEREEKLAVPDKPIHNDRQEIIKGEEQQAGLVATETSHPSMVTAPPSTVQVEKEEISAVPEKPTHDEHLEISKREVPQAKPPQTTHHPIVAAPPSTSIVIVQSSREMPLIQKWSWPVDVSAWNKRKSRIMCIMILPSDITRVTVVEHNAATSGCSSPRNNNFDEEEHLLNDQHVVVVKILKTDGKEKNCYYLESIQMTKSQNKECKFTGGYGDAKEEMEARFKSESDLDVFVKILEGLKRRQIARREHTLHQFLALKGLDPSSNLVVEMQVCSARNLPVADIKSSDPYCIIRMGNKEVHRTGVIKGNLNPKWTEKTKFSYTMFTTYKELFTSCEKIEFEVRDYDSLKTGESLGTVRLSPKAIVEAAQDGVEGEFRISNEEPNNSFLTLKFTKHQFIVQVEREEKLAVPEKPIHNDRQEIIKGEEQQAGLEGTEASVSTSSDESSSSTTKIKQKISWDIMMPKHSTHSVGGIYMPNLSLRKKSRRISLEIHHSISNTTGTSADTLTDFEKLSLLPGEMVMIKIYKPDDTNKNNWIPRYNFTTASFRVIERDDEEVKVETGLGDDKSVRELNFPKEVDAQYFLTLLNILKQKQKERDEQLLQQAMEGHTDLMKDTKLNILVEIVGARKLIIADFKTSDPFCIVRMGSKELHKTDYISKTLSPIWTVKTKSLFLLSVTPQEFFGGDCAGGLSFEVRDYDVIHKGRCLGKVIVPQQKILDGKGEREEFELLAIKENDHETTRGILALRFRRATMDDLDFMDGLNNTEKKTSSIERSLNLNKNELVGFIAPKANQGIRFKTTRTGSDGMKQRLVKPGPDPQKPKRTEWMTEVDIEKEYLKTSNKWIVAGSGNLAKIHVEVLGCDKLPNLDGGITSTGKDKTDAFVAIVYEDCLVNTEVINNSLSPRWLPWTRRAFSFQMLHPSSQLNFGVFDYDDFPGAKHDFIGRVSVDVTNFSPGTDYTLKYTLYNSSLVTKRKARGSITLRLRMEVGDIRKLYMASLLPPPPIHLNTDKKQMFVIAHQTCHGNVNVNRFGVDILSSYVLELLEYQEVMFYVQDAVLTLLLWRGHFDISLRVPNFSKEQIENDTRGFIDKFTKPVTISLPLHSLLAFILGTKLVENPQLLPSFFMASIAWLMIAVVGFLRDLPSPWYRPRSYRDLAVMYVTGKTTPQSIAAHEGEEKMLEYNLKWDERVEEARLRAARNAEEFRQQQEQDLAEIGDWDVDISTEQSTVMSNLNPLKPVLFPVQQILGIVCSVLRYIRNVVIWEESFVAFWITSACIVLSVVFMFLPWTFIIHWTCRIVIWSSLGPWMKLADIFYFRKNLSDKEQKLKQKIAHKSKVDQLALQSRVTRENASKLKDMRKYMFGKFITNVPRFKPNRHRDIPLCSSSAKSFEMNDHNAVERGIKTRVFGQHLQGEMIPRMASAIADCGEKENIGLDAASDNETTPLNPGKFSYTTA